MPKWASQCGEEMEITHKVDEDFEIGTGPVISIVATLYRSESYVTEFCERASAAAATLTDRFQIILVNDGSPDRSMEIAKDCADRLGNITVIDLSRNFGHHHAMMAGLRHATGQYVFLIDSDLEEEPEWLLQFYPKLREHGCDVVYGVQAIRRGGIVARVIGHLYYHICGALTGLAIPLNLVTARLMTGRYVDALLCFREREMDIAALWIIAGFDQQALPVVKHSSSPTTYTLARKIGLLVDSISSFSNRPLVGIFYFGTLLALISGTYALYLFVYRFFFGMPLEGWTSVMVSIWLVGGLIMSFIGIIGIYLAKVFSETKQRPTVIVRETYPASADVLECRS